MNGLNPKQRRFVREYLKDHNASRAYKRAGYHCKTRSSLDTAAGRLLRNVEVQSALQEAMNEQAKRTLVDADYVIHGLKREAEFRGDGCSHGARVKALESLGKHLGLFVDRIQHEGDLAVRIVELDAPADD